MQQYIEKLKTLIASQFEALTHIPTIVRSQDRQELSVNFDYAKATARRLYKLVDLILPIQKIGYMDGFKLGLEAAYKENQKALVKLEEKQKILEKKLLDHMVLETKNHIQQNTPLYVETQPFLDLLKGALHRFRSKESLTITLPDHLLQHIKPNLSAMDDKRSLVLKPRLSDSSKTGDLEKISIEGRHSIVELSLLEIIDHQMSQEKIDMLARFFTNTQDTGELPVLNNLGINQLNLDKTSADDNTSNTIDEKNNKNTNNEDLNETDAGEELLASIRAYEQHEASDSHKPTGSTDSYD